MIASEAGAGNRPCNSMKKIRALQQFSHYHAGSFDQNEVRPVADDIAEALVGMNLAVYADDAAVMNSKAEALAKDKADADAKTKEKAIKK